LTSRILFNTQRINTRSRTRLGKGAALLITAILLAACGQQTSDSAPTSAAVPIQTGLVQSGRAALHAALKGTSASEQSKWFVELSGDPMAIGTQSINAQQVSFRTQALAQGINYQEVASYHTLFNGFSVEANAYAIQRLARLPGVIDVSRVQKIELPKTPTVADPVTPQLVTAVGMTGADYAQNELGLTGKGVKVGVIDTGLDLTHPAFQGRVVASKDFAGDAYDGTNKPTPGPSVQDCEGHGTHVAGIVGGNDPSRNIKGVAPEVSFGIYRVFGCAGSADDDVILAAMEQAYKDGMQVVNMSLGSAFSGWAQSVDARAASRMVKAGIVMSISAGNSGTDGQYSIGAPSSGDNVIAVASVDNVKIELKTFTSTSAALPVGYSPVDGSPAAPDGSTLPLTKLASSTNLTKNDGCSAADGTSPYAANSLTGQAVLIRRGTCTFRSKVLNAQAAGAAAVLIYNNTAGFVSPSLSSSSPTDTTPITVSVLGLQGSDGETLSTAITAGAVKLTFNPGSQSFDNVSGNTLSNFSSYGMTPELELKPEVAAPGGLIRSAWPVALIASGSNTISGTSMAAPHVAGVAALLLQYKPDIQAKNMRGLMMNTAAPRPFLSGSTVTTSNDYIQQQGAGMVNVPNAVAALANGVSVTPSKLSLGESQTFATRSKVLVLHNDGPLHQIYKVTHLPALTLAGTTFKPVPSNVAATVTLNGTSVGGGSSLSLDLAPFSSLDLNVVVTPPAGAPDKAQYGGYIAFQSSTSGNLEVPYSGFYGDYQSIQALGDVNIGAKLYDFPLFEDGGTGADYEANENPTDISFDFSTTKAADGTTVFSAPSVLVNLAHQSRRLSFDLLDGDGKLVTNLSTENYLPRNKNNVLGATARDTYFTFPWDGTLADGSKAPNGKYQLRIKVLKALGDENTPADTEIYNSPVFAVARP
jgi:minor extracellular serine protease Vpr